MTIQEMHQLSIEAGLTGLKWARLTSGMTPSRLSLAVNGHVELRDEELSALENSLRAVIRERTDKFRRMLAGQPAAEAALSRSADD